MPEVCSVFGMVHANIINDGTRKMKVAISVGQESIPSVFDSGGLLTHDVDVFQFCAI